MDTDINKEEENKNTTKEDIEIKPLEDENTISSSQKEEEITAIEEEEKENDNDENYKNVFNKYYINLLKDIKTISKKHKEKSTTARKCLSSVKKNYSSVDKKTDEYITFFNSNINEELINGFIETDDIIDWVKDNENINIYIDINLGDILRLVRNTYLVAHYITMFVVFSKDINIDTTKVILNILQTMKNKELYDKIEDENIKKCLIKLEKLRDEEVKKKVGLDMNGLENTSIGKLAKEILDDLDLTKLKSSIGDDGDIFKAIGNPDSGFTDLLANVSKKMATKISSGEINHENILNDAMKFASMMPGMFGGNNKNPNSFNGGDIANMFKDLMKKKKKYKKVK